MRYRVYQLDETSGHRDYWGCVDEPLAVQVRVALTVRRAAPARRTAAGPGTADARAAVGQPRRLIYEQPKRHADGQLRNAATADYRHTRRQPETEQKEEPQ